MPVIGGVELTVKKEKLPSIKSISEMIEEIFCSSLRSDKESIKECKRLMKAKRQKKLSYEELLARLGVDKETFDRTLRKAVEDVKERL